jgi:signal transduction histidine kinase
MSSYKTQLDKFRQPADEKERGLIEQALRHDGGQLVSFAEEFVEKERLSVAKILLLAKKVPFVFLLVLLSLMILVVSFLIRQLMKNLNLIMDYTKRVGEGDFTPIKPDVKYQDEFTHLADAFNKMTMELNHRHTIILESHKLRAIGTLVAGVAHELNNPLNNTMLTTAVLKEDFEVLSDNEKIEMIDDLVNETERAQIIVKGLLDFARESETNIKPLQIDKIVKEAVRLVANQVKLAMVSIDTRFDSDLPRVHGDEQLLKQVFVNLILNAVDALPPKGEVKILVYKDKTPDYLFVEVKDNGPGIPEHLQRRIFEPFFTTKAQGKGTGLGLSVSLGIIRKLGGYIKLKSDAKEGTSFVVSLPITDSPSEIMSSQVISG